MYDTIATKEQLDRAIAALKNNGIDSVVAENGADAKEKVLAMIPKGSDVMTVSSVTVDSLGIAKELNESGDYDSVRARFASMDSKTQAKEMRAMAAAPDYVVGSVHAVTEDGKLIIASNSGSQLPAYVYGAAKVILVVGAQKITKDLEDGLRRTREYVLPLEGVRANKAYNITTGSFISKELVINRENVPGRISVVFVSEVVGF